MAIHPLISSQKRSLRLFCPDRRNLTMIACWSRGTFAANDNTTGEGRGGARVTSSALRGMRLPSDMHLCADGQVFIRLSVVVMDDGSPFPCASNPRAHEGGVGCNADAANGRIQFRSAEWIPRMCAVPSPATNE